MKNPRLLLWVLCAALAACSSPAIAGSIIDESFGAATSINEAMHPALEVGSHSAGSWWQLPDLGGIQWSVSGGVAQAHGGMPSPPDTSTLCYFGARPIAGWNATAVLLMFDYTSGLGGVNTFGVYGWNNGDRIPFGSNPGANGTPLITGILPEATVSAFFMEEQSAPLDGFDFIGLAVTMPGSLSGGSAHNITLDNVGLYVTPEPAAMAFVLGGLGAVLIKRRRRRIG